MLVQGQRHDDGRFPYTVCQGSFSDKMHRSTPEGSRVRHRVAIWAKFQEKEAWLKVTMVRDAADAETTGTRRGTRE